MKITNRPAEPMRVGTVDGRIVLLDGSGGIAWEDADESRVVARLFEFAVARESLNALDDTTDALERIPGDQPQFRAAKGRTIARNRLIIARSLPSADELRELQNRSMQLDLWRRAA